MSVLVAPVGCFLAKLLTGSDNNFVSMAVALEGRILTPLTGSYGNAVSILVLPAGRFLTKLIATDADSCLDTPGLLWLAHASCDANGCLTLDPTCCFWPPRASCDAKGCLTLDTMACLLVLVVTPTAVDSRCNWYILASSC